MGFETEYFEWKEWDELGVMEILFSDCTLKKDIGTFKRGDFIDSITIDFNNCKMEFYTQISGKVIETFKIGMCIDAS